MLCRQNKDGVHCSLTSFVDLRKRCQMHHSPVRWLPNSAPTQKKMNFQMKHADQILPGCATLSFSKMLALHTAPRPRHRRPPAQGGAKLGSTTRLAPVPKKGPQASACARARLSRLDPDLDPASAVTMEKNMTHISTGFAESRQREGRGASTESIEVPNLPIHEHILGGGGGVRCR